MVLERTSMRSQVQILVSSKFSQVEFQHKVWVGGPVHILFQPKVHSSEGHIKVEDMKSAMKLGKHVEEPISRDCLDRISSLPNELLGHMLSFLPTTRCAASTSILSTRWRYLFTFTDCLSFDDAPCFDDAGASDEIKAARQTRFKEFVYKVLELHQISPIKKFSLLCRGTYDELDLDSWVSNVVEKGVQEFCYEGKESVRVYDLFMCETLVRLRIMMYGIEIPLSAWLPKLKILHLEHVLFSDYDSVERLFSCCELLEELTLISCTCDSDDHVIVSPGLLKVLTIKHWSSDEGGLFEIDAPNLAYLTYSKNTGVKIVPSWKDSCSFVKAELMFYFNVDYSDDDDSLSYECELLKAAAYKTTELHFLSDCVQYLLTLVDYEQMPDFSSLSRLHLGNYSYDAWKHVTRLLEKSPQLETVIFDQGFDRFYSDPVSPPNETLNPFSCHVKVIEVHYFRGCEYSLLYMGHLLRNAGVLKTLIVHIDSDDREEDEITKDLLMLPKASNDCCIEFVGSEI